MPNISFPDAVTVSHRAVYSQIVATGKPSFLNRDDLRQEAALAAWLALPHYEAARASLTTYLSQVIRNRIASLRIAEARRLRGYRGVPLDSAALAAVPQRHDLRLDVARVLAAVSAHDRIVARYLCEHSPAAASRELGVSRAAVYRAIARLRMAFVEAGYHDGCRSSQTQRERCIAASVSPKEDRQ